MQNNNCNASNTPVTMGQQQQQQSLLYVSLDRSVILLDIPKSIEGSSPWRLLSVEALASPYVLPEPKDPTLVFNQELLDTHSRLRDSIVAALEFIRKEHGNQWCFEREIGATQDEAFLPFMTHDFKSNLSLLQSPSEEPLDIPDYAPGTFFDITDIYQSIVQNPSNQYHSLRITSTGHGVHNFIIPPRSSFLLAPIQSSINTFLKYSSRVGLFNCILLDPPWPNRSAERCKSAYETLSNHKDLLQLPLESSLRENGLVGVWVTNKPKWRKFVTEKLFTKWGVEYAGEWIWLKVTKHGEPVFNMESVMRKPYEMILFGRRPLLRKQLAVENKWRRGNCGERFPSPNVETQPAESRGNSPQPRVNMMPQKIIIAVPDLHSRKPCLKDLIKPFMPMNYTACEIFGRHLIEDWFTWGDEAIRFNGSEHWVSM